MVVIEDLTDFADPISHHSRFWHLHRVVFIRIFVPRFDCAFKFEFLVELGSRCRRVVIYIFCQFGYGHEVVISTDLFFCCSLLKATACKCLPHGHLMPPFLFLFNSLIIFAKCIVKFTIPIFLSISGESILIPSVICILRYTANTSIIMWRIMLRLIVSSKYFFKISMNLVSTAEF